MRRKPQFRAVNDNDWRWLWAAYQMDGWTDVMQEGMSKDEFQDVMLDLIGAVDIEWLAEVHGPKGLRPVALFIGDSRFGGHGVEVHAQWFPWATPRNKLEVGVAFFATIAKKQRLYAYAPVSNGALWERVWRYKVLKKGCKISDCYGRGEDAVMYYTPGPF